MMREKILVFLFMTTVMCFIMMLYFAAGKNKVKPPAPATICSCSCPC